MYKTGGVVFKKSFDFILTTAFQHKEYAHS